MYDQNFVWVASLKVTTKITVVYMVRPINQKSVFIPLSFNDTLLRM